MKFSSAYILVIFLVALCGQETAAQYTEKEFILYSVKNGLSSNEINCIQQDDWGYIWFGTNDGLNRFDGTSFKKFYQGKEPIDLPSDIITGFKKIGPHTLGIISRGGFKVLDTRSYKVFPYILKDTTAYTTPLNAVWDAAPLPDGSFALTTAAGFYVMNDTKPILRHDAFNIKDIGRKQMLFGRDIFNIGNGNYIVYTNEDGQALYNSRTKSFSLLDHRQASMVPFLHPRSFPGDRWIIKRQLNENEFLFIPLKSDSIIYYNSAKQKRVASALPSYFVKQLNWESHLEPVGNGTILLNSGYTGFYRLQLDHETGIIKTNEEKYLPAHHINCLLLDKENRLWAGTNQGMLKQVLSQSPVSTFYYPPMGQTPSPDFFTTVYRYKNILYAGQYSRHHGLSIIEASTMKRVKQIQFFGKDSPWNEVRSIEMYHPDTLWIGTWAGLLWLDTKTNNYGKVLDERKYPWAANFPAVLAPPRSDGYAWFCALLGARLVRYHIPSRSFTVFTPQTVPALPFEKVKSVVYDTYGDVWIGGHALTRWNNRLQQFDTLINVYAGANKFNDDIVALSSDDNGSLWMQNADNGLLEYKVREKRFVAYTMNDGLPSAAGNCLSNGINSKLWFTCNSQLCLFDTRSKQVTVYDHNDGLPEPIPTGHRIYLDSLTHLMYLCMENYLVRFPFTPAKRGSDSATLLIEELIINNNSSVFQPPGRIELNHNQNSLELHFTVVDFEKSNYQFFFRLDPGAPWNIIKSGRYLSLNNLAPGRYSLELSAVGESGIRKIRTVLIIIKPPFWKSAWFICFVLLFILSLLVWLFRARLKRVRQKAVVEKELSQTQMKALQSQMNPHFIFNSLNSIREMILSGANKDASHYLSQFAQLIRITLEQSTQETVLLRATVDYLQRYIEMETIRNEFLQYKIEVDPDLDVDEVLVSPMIIQPFVENAIWHGVSATSKSILVKISFKRSGDSLQCIIDDNGIGILHSRSIKRPGSSGRRSHGIVNVEDRIELISKKYDQACSVTIIDKKEDPAFKESGTVVTILLPYQTTDI